MTSNRHIAAAPRPSRKADSAPESAHSNELRGIPPTVLDAVRESVLAVGVRRTTLTDVARRAGVSRMTLYRMVPDVETLLLELLTREFSALMLDVEARVARRRTSRARLVGMIAGIARQLPEAPLFRRIVDVDPELLLPYLSDRLGSTQRFALGHVRRVITEGHGDGSIRRGDADVMAGALTVAVTSFIVSTRLLDQFGRDAALRELERGFEGWLRP